MKTINTFEDLPVFLESFLQDSLGAKYTHARQQYLGLIIELLERQQAILKSFKKRNTEQSKSLLDICSGFHKLCSDLHTNLEKHHANNKIPVLICDLAVTIDEELILAQNKQRFTVNKDDNTLLKLAKSGKKIIRGFQTASYRVYGFLKKLVVKNAAIGAPDWKQTIAMRAILCYQMAREYRTYKTWLDDDLNHYTRFLDDYKKMVDEWITAGTVEALSQPEVKHHAHIEMWLGLIDEHLEKLNAAKKLAAGQTKTFLSKKNNELTSAIEVAGTIESTPNSFYKKQSPKVLQDLDTELTTVQQKQIKIAGSQIQEIDAVIEFAQFGGKLHRRINKTSVALISLHDNSAVQQISAIEYYLEHLQLPGNEKEGWQEKSEEVQDQFESNLAKPLEKELRQNRLPNLCKDLAGDLLVEISKLPASLPVITIDKSNQEYRIEEEKYDLNKLVARFFKQEVINDLTKRADNINNTLNLLLKDVRQAETIAATTLISAGEASAREDAAESPVDIGRKGLQNAKDKVVAIQHQAEEAYHNLTLVIEQNITQTYGNLLTHIKQRKVDELLWKEKEYMVRAKAGGWQTRLNAYRAKAEDFLAIRYRFLAKKSANWYNKIAPWLGLGTKEADVLGDTDIVEYLTETTGGVDKLPFVYRYLFDTQQIADERFYIQNPPVNSKFKKALESWRDQQQVIFGLAGERGSGKSAFVKRIENFINPGEQVTCVSIDSTIYQTQDLLDFMADKLSLPSCDTPKQMVEELTKTPERRIIIIENLQNLYLRTINGFNAAEMVLLMMNQTSKQIFWVTTGSRYAWSYLDEVIQISNYFTHIEVCDDLQKESITDIILRRHEASGYDLVYQPTEEIRNSRTYKKYLDDEQSLQNYLKTIYFERLTSIAEGNTSIAIKFWLRSIKAFDEHKVEVSPVEIKPFTELLGSPQEILFTLTAFVLHDRLTVEQLSAVLNHKEQKSRILISHLVSKGILAKEDNEYSLNFLIYRQVVRYLKQRNIIHLTDI